MISDKKVMVELEIGEVRKNCKIKNSELMARYQKKYKLEQRYQIIFTNGLVQKDKINTEVGIVIDNSEVAYNMSIDKRCSVYTAEAIAIEKALGYVKDMNIDKHILILTDSQSVCKAIANNDIRRFPSKQIRSIKERVNRLGINWLGII